MSKFKLEAGWGRKQNNQVLENSVHSLSAISVEKAKMEQMNLWNNGTSTAQEQ